MVNQIIPVNDNYVNLKQVCGFIRSRNTFLAMPNVEISPERQEDAARLLRLFNEKKRVLGLTQELLAMLCGYAQQSVVNNYFHGRIPLNVRAAMGFAKHLQVGVGEFSPSLQAEIDEIAAFASGNPAALVQANTDEWPFSVPRGMHDRLSDGDKERLNVMVDSFIRAFATKDKPRKKPSRAA